jgi:hypothetical protein
MYLFKLEQELHKNWLVLLPTNRRWDTGGYCSRGTSRMITSRLTCSDTPNCGCPQISTGTTASVSAFGSRSCPY